tara:strand:+ start:1119 stop:1412 length:294 start_codon:yes stop_codon:yes gene_type:complete
MMLETLSTLKQEYDSEIERIARAVRDLGWTPGSDSDDIANAVIDSTWLRNPAAVLACTGSVVGFVWPAPVGEPVTLDALAYAAMVDDAWDALERDTA